MRVSAMQRGTWGAALALAGLLNGCAVLTVDVDVYKGALINEEHVQLHQLMALATGAQPMLVQLRDNLEWPDSDGLPPKGVTKKSEKPKRLTDMIGEVLSPSPDCTNRTSWYNPGYVNPSDDYVPEYKSGGKTFWEALPFVTPTCYSHFQKPHARRVNRILGLYENLDPKGQIVEPKDQKGFNATSTETNGLKWLFALLPAILFENKFRAKS